MLLLVVLSLLVVVMVVVEVMMVVWASYFAGFFRVIGWFCFGVCWSVASFGGGFMHGLALLRMGSAFFLCCCFLLCCLFVCWHVCVCVGNRVARCMD